MGYMKLILLFLFCVIAYHEIYLAFAPLQNWDAEKNIAIQAVDLAPPPFGKNTSALKMCIRDVNIRYVGYVPGNISAYVTLNRFWSGMNIYVTMFTFYMSRAERVDTLIHECTHIVYCTEDVAYMYEDAYYSLPPEEESRNADSYVEYFYPYVRQAVRQWNRGWRIKKIQQNPTMLMKPVVQGSLLRSGKV